MERRGFLKGLSASALAAGIALPVEVEAQRRRKPPAPGPGGIGGNETAQRGLTDPRTPLPQGPATTDRPNVIWIVSDQQRAGIGKSEGYPLDTRPTLDALGARGISFNKAYCTTPLCLPSRTGMLTGRWPEATRVRSNPMGKEAYFYKDMFQVAREQGYMTGMAGKNHTYLTADRVDFFRDYGHEGGWLAPNAPQSYRDMEAWLKSLHYNVAHEPSPYPLETQLCHRVASDAIDFIRMTNGRRFCLEISFPEPHDPEQVPKEYWDMFPPDSVPARIAGPEELNRLGFREQWLHQLGIDGDATLDRDWRRYLSNYLGAVRMIDDQVKRVVDFLDEQKLSDKTVIVFMADHGDYMMDVGLARKGVGLPDALARVPMIWWGAGIKHDEARAHDCHVSIADLMPTFCDFMGAEIPYGVQGRSLRPVLTGQDYARDEFRSIYAGVGLGGLYYEAQDHIPTSIAIIPHGAWDELNKVTLSGNTKMVRMGDWKLIYDMMGNGQMYHLPSDPLELNNRFEDPGVAKERDALLSELLAWTIRAQDDLPTGSQNEKYHTKWPEKHNWYAPERRAPIGKSYRP